MNWVYHEYPWVSGKMEVPIRLIIVVKNKNCQGYLCVFPVFPSSPLSRRFSIFNKLSFHFPCHLQHGLTWPRFVLNSTALFRIVLAPSMGKVRSHSRAKE